MAKQDNFLPQPLPSTQADELKPQADLTEPTLAEIDTRATTVTTVLHEILAQREENFYVHHWGINE